MWDYLKNTTKPIVLYGTGNGADKILNQLSKASIKVSGVFASDGFVRNRSFRGYEVESYSDIKKRLGDVIILMCFGSNRQDVRLNVEKLMQENEFYVPDVPVYGDVIFDANYYEDHKYELELVRSMLADELSVKTFDAIMSYRLSGDISYVFDCEEEEERKLDLIKLPKDSEYLDLGAYNGDTVVKYSEAFKNISSVIAVEPDSKNFKKLCKTVEQMKCGPQVQVVNAVVSDKDGMASLVSSKGRGVHEFSNLVCDVTASNVVPCISVDSLVQDRMVNLIKMDVEGNEGIAIQGAIATIRRCNPYMILSCYHRSEDIHELPLRVLGLSNRYDIYLRHSPSIPAWDSEFIFVPK